MACGDGPSKGIVHSQTWSYSSVTEDRELARQHARRRKKHVSFQRLAVVHGSSPVLGPPVLTRSGYRARCHSTSTIISTSTALLKGSPAIPTAERACFPASPNTSTIKSENPFITFGWSPKSSAELTIPKTFTTRFT